MVGREGRKPVAQHVEESKALHVGKSAIINVTTVFLHVANALHAFLHFVHSTVKIVAVENVLQGILFLFMNAVAIDCEVLILYDSRHDVFADRSRVFVNIETVDHLHLHL